MATITARFVVKDVTDENGQMRVVLRAKTQAEGANTENPVLFPDAECPEEQIRLKLIASATNAGIFLKTRDVLVNFNGPA